MNILHYLNVIIGFSLVMLLLSIITSFIAQGWLALFKTKVRAVERGFIRILVDIGLEENDAKQQIDSLLNEDNFVRFSFFGIPWKAGDKFLGWVFGLIRPLITWMSEEKNMSREGLVLLLLRKASLDNVLASKLGYGQIPIDIAKSKLDAINTKRNANPPPALPASLDKAIEDEIPDTWKKFDSNNIKDLPQDIKLQWEGNQNALANQKTKENFIYELLEKCITDNNEALAVELGFIEMSSANNAKAKLDELEKKILEEETKDPTLPAQVWRTNAMNAVIPDLAAKIFARFDGVMDRVNENVEAFAKLAGSLITFIVLLAYYPVNSIDLIYQLNNDQVLSQKLADVAEANVKPLAEANEKLLQCQKTSDPNKSDSCKTEMDNLKNITKNTVNAVNNLDSVAGLFPKTEDLDNDKTFDSIWLIPMPVPMAKLNFGIFITWILVSLGGAFWLGILNKMLGMRSEFSKKLDAQREFRAQTVSSNKTR